MKNRLKPLALAGVCIAVSTSIASAREFETEIIAEGLASPTAISMSGSRSLFYSEVPTPGVPGTEGGENTVMKLDLRRGSTTTISEGEPYPINIAVDRRGNAYWTCKTAGVILRYDRRSRDKDFFLPSDIGEEEPSFLLSPNGIAVHHSGDVLFTELPLPGVSGPNMVSASDGQNITVLSSNEPAPTDIAVAYDGTAYWTCNTAGVIVRKSPSGVISVLKTGLESPTGIALDPWGRRLYYTELPTPGVPGFPDNDQGGTNRVVELDLRSMETNVVSTGFPLPQDVTVASNGKVYWTCTAAGVIACATPKPEKRKYRWSW